MGRAAAGEPVARFLVDTWIGFGLEVFAIGAVLLLTSGSPRSAVGLVWVVIGIEVSRGLVYDTYMIVQGYPLMVYVPWIVVHLVVVATGLDALRRARVVESQFARI